MVSIVGFNCPSCGQGTLAYKSNGRGAYCTACGHELSYGELFDAEWPEGDPFGVDPEMLTNALHSWNSLVDRLQGGFKPEDKLPPEALAPNFDKPLASKMLHVSDVNKISEMIDTGKAYFEMGDGEISLVPNRNQTVSYQLESLKPGQYANSDAIKSLLKALGIGYSLQGQPEEQKILVKINREDWSKSCHVVNYPPEPGGLTAAQVNELIEWLQREKHNHTYYYFLMTLDKTIDKINQLRGQHGL